MTSPNKEIKDVKCKGRLPGTSIKCDQVLYQSDGEYLMVGGLVVNPDLIKQKIICDKCGYRMHWSRKTK